VAHHVVEQSSWNLDKPEYGVVDNLVFVHIQLQIQLQSYE
jgi:hypothetical protein